MRNVFVGIALLTAAPRDNVVTEIAVSRVSVIWRRLQRLGTWGCHGSMLVSRLHRHRLKIVAAILLRGLAQVVFGFLDWCSSVQGCDVGFRGPLDHAEMG